MKEKWKISREVFVEIRLNEMMLTKADVGKFVFGCAQMTKVDYDVSPVCHFLINKTSLKHIVFKTLP